MIYALLTLMLEGPTEAPFAFSLFVDLSLYNLFQLGFT
jgi:hypothetical protein